MVKPLPIAATDAEAPEWRISDAPVPYEVAVREMEERVAAIAEGRAPELVWLLEHPPLYTAGTSAEERDLVDPERFPVFQTGRGGQYTYHGPGQRVAYVMLDLKRRKPDVREFVGDLEKWLIATLAEFNVTGELREGRAPELVWLLEHPPLYTAGTSAEERDLVDPERFPVFQTGRGGQYTYHGPGQRVAYVMLDLKRRKPDVREFVGDLEKWLIATLAEFNVTGELREGRVGVWVRRPEKGFNAEDKIAAIGVRIRKWVTFHGVSLNVDPDLDHFTGIVPCGISQHGVTSLADLGITATMADVDIALKRTFAEVFGAA